MSYAAARIQKITHQDAAQDLSNEKLAKLRDAIAVGMLSGLVSSFKKALSATF